MKLFSCKSKISILILSWIIIFLSVKIDDYFICIHNIILLPKKGKVLCGCLFHYHFNYLVYLFYFIYSCPPSNYLDIHASYFTFVKFKISYPPSLLYFFHYFQSSLSFFLSSSQKMARVKQLVFKDKTKVTMAKKITAY